MARASKGKTDSAGTPHPALSPAGERRKSPTRRPRSSTATATANEVHVDGRTLKLSNLRKVLYPQAGFTKAQVIDYYHRIAPALLTHLKGRPLTLKRYPDGVDGESFYEKNAPRFRPDWLHTVAVQSDAREREINYCVIDDLASLIWVANLASLELHTSLSLAKDLTRPTALAFDLDPGLPADALTCARVALLLREVLQQLGLQGFVKTSGSKGLQLYVPLNGAVTYDDTKAFAHAMARLLEERHPELVTSEMKKKRRPGKVFIDWSQNDDHKTTVCVYSLRARERPTASTPLRWEEVEAAVKSKRLADLVFEAPAVIARLEKYGDLFAPVATLKQKLPLVSHRSASMKALAVAGRARLRVRGRTGPGGAASTCSSPALAIAGKGKPSLTVIAEVPARPHSPQAQAATAAGRTPRWNSRWTTWGRASRTASSSINQSGAAIGPARSTRSSVVRMARSPCSSAPRWPAPLELRLDPARFDAKAHTLIVTFNRDADRGSVETFGEGGQRLGLVENQELGGAKAGEPLTLAFEDEGQPALKLHVAVYDPNGLFAGLDLFPWSMKVPHAEVNFASGSAEIQPAEQQKLKDSAARIAESLARVGQVAPLRLFIAGYTDTVGPAESNQTLSSQRAQSIARYFRAHGIGVPILTAGLGEDALLIGTPDETPEVRNRRAEYILAVDPPPIEHASKAPAWTPLGEVGGR